MLLLQAFRFAIQNAISLYAQLVVTKFLGYLLTMRVVSENFESKAFVRWVRYDMQGVLELAHMPNEALGRLFEADPQYAKLLKAMGVSKGFPDYIITHTQTHKTCFVEMKKRRGGVRSPEQKRWIKALGKKAKFCNGYLEARKFVEERLLK